MYGEQEYLGDSFGLAPGKLPEILANLIHQSYASWKGGVDFPQRAPGSSGHSVDQFAAISGVVARKGNSKITVPAIVSSKFESVVDCENVLFRINYS